LRNAASNRSRTRPRRNEKNQQIQQRVGQGNVNRGGGRNYNNRQRNGGAGAGGRMNNGDNNNTQRNNNNQRRNNNNGQRNNRNNAVGNNGNRQQQNNGRSRSRNRPNKNNSRNQGKKSPVIWLIIGRSKTHNLMSTMITNIIENQFFLKIRSHFLIKILINCFFFASYFNNLGKNTKPEINRDALDKELDQYMATTKTENSVEYLLRWSGQCVYAMYLQAIFLRIRH